MKLLTLNDIEKISSKTGLQSLLNSFEPSIPYPIRKIFLKDERIDLEIILQTNGEIISNFIKNTKNKVEISIPDYCRNITLVESCMETLITNRMTSKDELDKLRNLYNKRLKELLGDNMENKVLNKIENYLKTNNCATIEIIHHYNFNNPNNKQIVKIDDVLFDDINKCYDFYYNGDKVAIANHSETINIID